MGDSENYAKAKADPIASLVLVALREQDVNTYHGSMGDMGGLALKCAEQVRVLLDLRPEILDVCPTHLIPLIHEEGGPDKPSVHGRTYCPDCQTEFNTALDTLTMKEN